MLHLLHTLYITEAGCFPPAGWSGFARDPRRWQKGSYSTAPTGTDRHLLLWDGHAACNGCLCRKRDWAVFSHPKRQIPLPHSGRSTRKCTSASASIRFARRGTLPSGSVCIKRETAKLQSASEPPPEKPSTTGAGRLQAAENTLSQIEASLDTLQSEEALRSAEGQAARVYFSVFQDLILSDDRAFHFQGRNRRPPKDPCNAMLSFAYTLLTNDCIQALESAGLDPYVGYFHGTRSGKPSLALDLVEEFRPVMADRTVLHLINLKMLTSDLFAATDDGGIYLNDTGRAVFLREWNQMKHREIQIGCTDQPVPMGLMPYLQAQQLSRYLRGEQANFTTIDRR